MRSKITLILLASISFHAMAAGSIEEAIQPLLDALDSGKHSELATIAFPPNSYGRRYISSEDIERMDREFENILKSRGKLFGASLIHESVLDDTYAIKYYIYRFNRHPIMVKIDIYKPDKEWRINNLSINNNVDEYIEEADKVYIGSLGTPALLGASKANQ